MASVLKVDKLDPQSGTALEIGTSGDTITVPSGATFTVSGTMNASSITAGTLAIARGGTGATTLAGADLVNTPAFHVDWDDSSSQDIDNDTGTKMLFDTERIDTDGCYDNSSNYRFTPTTAGIYFAYAQLSLNSTTDYPAKYWISEIRKNGTTIILNQNPQSYYTCAPCNIIVDMNGSSDYLECFGYQTASSTLGTNNSKFYSFFGGFRLI